ncbi:MAG: hypothetical protein WCT35_04825 [Sideroxydans sp.]|jgi:hypothetical protein
MLTFKLEGFDELQRKLADSPRKLEIATQRAMLKTAEIIRDRESKHIEKVFNKPTSWTRGAMRVKVTGKLEVSVGIVGESPADKRKQSYLSVQMEGGKRRMKGFERALLRAGILPMGWLAMPGEGAVIDGYGNMSVGQIKQIMSWFSAAEPYSGSTQNMTDATRDKRRKGTRSKVGFEYVYVRPGAQKNLKQPGIYQRFFLGHGSALKPVLIFVRKGTSYKPIFRFKDVAQVAFEDNIQDQMDKAIELELFK